MKEIRGTAVSGGILVGMMNRTNKEFKEKTDKEKKRGGSNMIGGADDDDAANDASADAKAADVEKNWKNIGNLISRLLKANDLITFEGDLGVGKTFLCKSIINSITDIKEVPSPTFNLVQTYPLNKVIEIWHCDFYRINNFVEVEEIGVFEDLKKKLFC